ncbi:Gamma-glutamyl cyclotransferase, AIG2-like [Meinhardsimonia xiamenensis]|uniref:Gamma-glutamyl cyclotransferase, AIG2-like n=2 Tax=Meinhardsimonia xiamenensis TaxID=990712 RepID=A0A1G9E4F3_9RHOB|nr:gamma-glutamyl AIG2-like cyclotransferase [Meinhardsimonia xiamenensis]SDK70937.1 Gamma-glutamyl cyclotransferase, AIG2-like [Meinhardsimonia xiamenensis]
MLRAMADPFFFGYGSLVNRATHGYVDAYPARVKGWRRVWRHTALRPVAFLTAEPAPDVEIEGLMAAVPGGDWRALDERERAYERRPVTEAADHPVGRPVAVHIYTIPEGRHGRPDEAHPVLLSYLDTVVQGYLREFGEEGVARFFLTTAGWDAPILNDRDGPRYPRARSLRPEERVLVDDWLRDIEARVIQAT